VDAVEVAAEEAHDVVVEAVRARSIRVDQRRLDQLMNLIGELAIARGRLRTLTAKQDDPTSARCRW
jgi:chemotaxis protein histidine kinase CheA